MSSREFLEALKKVSVPKQIMSCLTANCLLQILESYISSVNGLYKDF